LADEKQQGEVVITVPDNSVGIPPDRLQCVLNAKAEGIGIRNVNGRLTSIYGNEYQVSICSVEGKGTQVTLRIPEGGRPRYKG